MDAAKPDWRRRFDAPSDGFPSWSVADPRFVVFTSRRSASLQAWVFDTEAGEARLLTDEPIGVEHTMASGDGAGAIWWQDATGDERGRWLLTAFDAGGPGDATPVFPDLPLAWAEGIGAAAGVTAAGFSDENGYRVFVSHDGGPATLLADSPPGIPIGIGREWYNGWNGLSPDGRLLCIRVAEQGDITKTRLRVLDTRSGEVLAELADPGSHLLFAAWSPFPGDSRMAFVHMLENFERPGIWNPSTDERRNLEIKVPGGVDVDGWWPDGSALLGRHTFEGRAQLCRIGINSGRLEFLDEPQGWIEAAGVRPDGDVWFRAESSQHAPAIRNLAGTDTLRSNPQAISSPPGTAYRPFHFENPAGQRIHGFVAEPSAGTPPFPTVLMVHGGPDWAYADAFDAHAQAFVDNGYLVAMVNYRGSTTYGADFANAIKGNVGFPEVEDLLAGLDALVANGLADPKRVVVEGWSWGGYLSLLAPGLHPDRFAAAIGGIPVADYIACHEDASPVQQAWDLAINGCSPDDNPGYYRERSPITYANRITAPVLMIAGENDSRCPIRQVRQFEAALQRRGRIVETHSYASGHHASEAAELASFAEVELDFLQRNLPGAPSPLA